MKKCFFQNSAAAVATLCLVFHATILSAVPVALNSEKESFIRQSQATTNQGQARLLFGGQGTSAQFRTMMQFSLDDLVAATGGGNVIINSVSLDTGDSFVKSGTFGGDATYDAYSWSVNDFDVADNTWNDPQGSLGTDGPGATLGTKLASEVFGAGTPEGDFVFPSAAPFIAFVQGAYDSYTAGDKLNLLLVIENTALNHFARTDSGAVTGIGTAALTIDFSVDARAVLVTENFQDALTGTSAETFHADVTAAGGSASWGASSRFTANGVVDGAVGTGDRCGYLNLGSYINDTKGRGDGLFELTMTISEVGGNAAGDLIALGFSAKSTAPNIGGDFVNQTGIGTIAYRQSGELDMWGGSGVANGVDGPNGNSGPRVLTAALDLTPAGGYDGATNFGTVSWSDGALGALGTHTFTAATDFNWILLSSRSDASGTISSLSLKQQAFIPGAIILVR